MRPPLDKVIVSLGGFGLGWYLQDRPGSWEGISYATLSFWIIAFSVLLLVVTAGRYKSFFSALGFALNPSKRVRRLILAWNPHACKTHKAYQRSLATFLSQKLPDVKVTQESGSGRFRADIEVDREVVIELKPNFNSTAKLQQLIGQIEMYGRNFPDRAILAVLVGKTDDNTYKSLEEVVEGKDDLWLIRKDS